MATVKLDHRSPDSARLLEYGFRENSGDYIYETHILDSQFRLLVRVGENSTMTVNLFDVAADEEYVLHLDPGATGGFIGRVRAEYNAIVDDILRRCFDIDVFKSRQAAALIKYAREKYGSEPEYLWAKTPDNAVLRRADNAKWYAAILTAARSSLGLSGDGKAEVVDLRADAQLVVNGETILPGYHMNKKNWITIPLDGRVSDDELFAYVDSSYILAGVKPKKPTSNKK